MSKSRERLLEIASAVAEGQRVDWSSLRDEEPDLDDTLANLSRIEALARGFAENMQRDDARRLGIGGRKTWGHLELVEELGDGSFGRVWKAFDPVLQREVALKLRHEVEGVSDDPGGREFIDEARRLAKVRHPNILGVHGADVHGGRVGLWADLHESETLEASLEDSRTLPFERQLEIARDLTHALEAVHAADLVHGDVKAGNVALEADGRAVLLDFGAGVDLGDGAGGDSSYGSPLSSSPQRLAGEALSAPDDLWSLGVLLFRLASGGSYPFPAETLDELGELQADAERSWRNELKPVPRAYRHLISGLLAHGSEDRPTAAQALAELGRIAGAPARLRRNLAVAAVVASLTLGLVAASVGAWRARVAARVAEAAQLDAQETTRFLSDLLQAPRLTESGGQVRVVDVLDSAAAGIEATLPEGSAVRAQIWEIVGGTYLSLGQHAEAEPMLRRALDELGSRFGPDHVWTLTAHLKLVQLLGETDRQEEADEHLQRVVDGSSTLPVDHSLHVYLAINQGSRARRLGLLEEAEGHLAQAWALRSDPKWRGDAARHSAIAAYATVLMRRGRFPEVVALVEPVFDEMRERSGWNNQNVLTAANSLAQALGPLNRREEALALWSETARAVSQWLGRDHRIVLQMQNNRLATLRELGRAEEALVLAREEEIVDWSRRIFGALDANTLMVETNVALALRDLGRTQEALERLEQIHRSAQEKTPPANPARLIHAVNYAEMLLEARRGSDAITVLQPVRDAFVPVLGEGHYFLLAADSILVASRAEGDSALQARDELREVLEAQRKIGGADEEQVLITQIRLARVERARGDLEQAKQLLEEVLELGAVRLPLTHPMLRQAQALLDG